jgi:hypothetical protein
MLSPKLSCQAILLTKTKMQNLRWSKTRYIIKPNRTTSLRDARLHGFWAVNDRIVAAQGLDGIRQLIGDNVYYLTVHDTIAIQEENMKCQDCLYWQISDHTRDEGACRRNAPRPRHVERELTYAQQPQSWTEDGLSWIAWPCTRVSDWCGEFKKRDKGQPTVY